MFPEWDVIYLSHFHIKSIRKHTIKNKQMKTIKLIFTAIILSTIFVSCSSDDDNDIIANPMEGFNLVTSFDANNHSIELYSKKNDFNIGFNEVYIRIKDIATKSYVSQSEISWMPMMHMTQMEHSCPKSTLTVTEDKTVSKGFMVFQMPGNADEYWDITITYTINGEEFTAKKTIDVISPADGKQKISTFMGSDGTRYVLTMTAPTEPKVAVNDFTAMLFKMENMMTFPVVENYKIIVDPRMPGMGNHSSPNNEDLSYDAALKMYKGKLSLTMTGYWKINLKLLNESQEVLKGEDVTVDNLESSLFFEIEF